jgi:phospholipid-binding lipoprotein MlaA
VRDSAGLVVDYFGNPLTYVSPDSVSWALYGVNLINVRANLLGATDVLADAALDKYSFVRNAYLQRRQYLISGGDSNMPDYGEAPLPNYGDEGAAPAAGASATAAPASASGTAAAPAPASGPSNTVPGNQYVPPSGFPSFRLR